MSKPIIDQQTWEECARLNNSLKEAILNPNTDFMTKLLFDARLLEKRTGKELTYWSNVIVKIKLLLSKNKALTAKEIASKTGLEEADELLTYLKGMAEVLEENGKYKINYNNPFSKLFKS